MPWLLVIVAYFVGGIPIGLLVGRTRGVDLTQVGSGNIGASNVMRTLGTKLGIVVWLADLLKGLVPVVWTRFLLHGMDNPWPWIAAAGFAAVAGHCFSPYLRMRGGRGVSTSLGIILALDWRVGLIAFGLWIFLLVLTRYISLASMIATASTPVLLRVMKPAADPDRTAFVVVTAIIAALVILKHLPNLKRLLSGTEPKVGEKAEIPVPEGIEGGPESETEYR